MQRGFSLLEILVAFSILALSLGILMQIFGKGINLATTSDAYTRATLIAESVLAGVGVVEPLEEGEQSGELDDLYTWSVRVIPHEFEDADIDVEALPFTVFRVEVEVSWGNRSVNLDTLRIGSETEFSEL